ncbi:MAG: type IV pilus twitching motility protein PilT [Deltaproteobacteria bacterium]|nr:type IV pilus twitching motility protein PilT [Deltaproteobacteria bacterium]
MDLAAIARSAVNLGASDIHFKVGLPPLMRLHGDIKPIPGFPATSNDELGRALWDIMNAGQRERFKTTNECDLAHSFPELARFRVNVFRQQGKIGAVLRTIPTTVKTIDELKLPPVLKKIAAEPRGLVLVTGATGSGKSTTLASIIEEINRTESCHILTIEDPVEFVFQDKRSVVNQREVGIDALNFHNALRAALRQDPDAILIGELRDLETVEIALSAAETGHLVLGTLHTVDAHETINRIIGFFEPHHQPQVRLLLGSVLRAVVSQRLVPGAQGDRVAALEVMINTGTIYECIVDSKRTREIRDYMRKGRATYNTQTFDQHLYELIQQGRVKSDEGLKYANNPDELALRLSGLGADDD